MGGLVQDRMANALAAAAAFSAGKLCKGVDQLCRTDGGELRCERPHFTAFSDARGCVRAIALPPTGFEPVYAD